MIASFLIRPSYSLDFFGLSSIDFWSALQGIHRNNSTYPLNFSKTSEQTFIKFLAGKSLHKEICTQLQKRLGSESNFMEETMKTTDIVARKLDSDPNLS